MTLRKLKALVGGAKTSLVSSISSLFGRQTDSSGSFKSSPIIQPLRKSALLTRSLDTLEPFVPSSYGYGTTADQNQLSPTTMTLFEGWKFKDLKLELDKLHAVEDQVGDKQAYMNAEMAIIEAMINLIPPCEVEDVLSGERQVPAEPER